MERHLLLRFSAVRTHVIALTNARWDVLRDFEALHRGFQSLHKRNDVSGTSSEQIASWNQERLRPGSGCAHNESNDCSL